MLSTTPTTQIYFYIDKSNFLDFSRRIAHQVQSMTILATQLLFILLKKKKKDRVVLFVKIATPIWTRLLFYERQRFSKRAK